MCTSGKIFLCHFTIKSCIISVVTSTNMSNIIFQLKQAIIMFYLTMYKIQKSILIKCSILLIGTKEIVNVAYQVCRDFPLSPSSISALKYVELDNCTFTYKPPAIIVIQQNSKFLQTLIMSIVATCTLLTCFIIIYKIYKRKRFRRKNPLRLDQVSKPTTAERK